MTGLATVSIRTAEDSDRPSIVEVVRHAFANDGRDGGEEVGIVHATWASAARVPELELVAVERGLVVGHVLAAFGTIAGAQVVGVAPLAVAPDRQGLGVGSALMGALIERASRAGLPMLLLLGDPGYYSRFGFEAAGPLGIFYGPAGAGSPHFLALVLADPDRSLRGEFVYAWEDAGS